MLWQKVKLTSNEIINDKLNTLMHAFAQVHLSAGAPTDAAMFADRDDDNAFYFSPRAVAIAGTLISRFGGKDCPAPRSSAMHLLVGSQSRAGVPFSAEPAEQDNS